MKFRLDIRTLKPVVCLLAVLALFLGGMLLLHGWEEGQARVSETATDDQDLTWYDGNWYALRDDVETVLILGIDKAALDESIPVQGKYEQSDLMMLLALDKAAQKCTAVRINRSTMTEFDRLDDAGQSLGKMTAQITLAHAYGSTGTIGCLNSARAVSNLFYGIKINHYISLYLDGVPVLTDLVGGVPVSIEDDFSSIDSTLVQGETILLSGQQALTYVRTRKGLEDESDLKRMDRQYQYFEALQTQLIGCSKDDEDFWTNAILAINDYLVSDCTANQLSQLGETLGDWSVSDYRTIEGEGIYNGNYFEFYPDEDALQALTIELFYEERDVDDT